MLQSFRKHIHTVVGLLVFVHLLFYNSRPASSAVFSTDITGSFSPSHGGSQLESGAYSKKLAKIRFPNERRKYGLNETNNALISFQEVRVNYNTDTASFKRNNQIEIPSSCFSLALLRAPPAA